MQKPRTVARRPVDAASSGKALRTGIQSIEVGAPLLREFAEGGGALSLTVLASQTGMAPSKAHKYLASFVRIGLLSQDPASTLYSLGPLAMEIGLAAIRQIDVVDLAQDHLDDLLNELKLTASLAIWTERGPVIVRKAENRQAVSLVVPLGASLPVLTSSNGRIFATFHDRRATAALIDAEMGTPRGAACLAGLATPGDVDAMTQAVRQAGMATVIGLVQQNTSSISAPVFDHTGRLAASITVLGFSGSFDTSPGGRPHLRLQAAAQALSADLGASRPLPARRTSRAERLP